MTRAERSGDAEHSLVSDGFALRLIHRKARRLARCPGFTAADQDDLEQELKLKVWEARDKFDSRRSHRHAFVATVVERAAATLARDRRAIKRGNHLVHLSLSMDALSEHGQESLDAAGDDVACTPSRETEIDLACDVAELVSQLPCGLREVADLLGNHSKRRIATALGISRRALDRRINALRACFVAAGLERIS
jgi:DNA-directed RNA polymerase specialized sigma24 family protein